MDRLNKGSSNKRRVEVLGYESIKEFNLSRAVAYKKL